MNRAALALAFALASCGPPPTTLKKVTFGAVIDRTGSIANPTWPPAVELAVAHANAGLDSSAKWKNFQYEGLISDSTNVTSVAATRALELVQQKGAKALITDTSGDSVAINKLNYDADTTNDLGVPLICQACTSPDINKPTFVNANDAIDQETKRNTQGWFFRSTMDSDPQAVVQLNIAMGAAPTAIPRGDKNGDGKFKVSVSVIDDSFGNGFADGLVRGAAALNLTPPAIVEVIKHPRDANVDSYDWAATVGKLTDNLNDTTALVDGVPDIVIVVDFPQYSVAITKAYLNIANAPRLLHSHNFRHESVVLKLQTQVVGQEGTSHVLLDGDSGTRFAADYQAANSAPPQFWAANTYDSAMVIMLAMAVAIQKNDLADPTAVTGAQILTAMREINDPAGTKIGVGAAEFAKAIGVIKTGGAINYDGASGPMDFDANGNVNGRLARWKYQNNAFEDVERFDCVSNRASCPPVP